jgi:tryptophanyl-tRNA synthetase
MKCAKKIIEILAPSYEQRAYFAAHMDDVKNILADGERRAQVIAKQTMNEVHEAMKLG